MKLAELTNEQARSWLIANDREAADFWENCAGSLIGAGYDNLNSFGYSSQLGDIIIERVGGEAT
jgi:hypothetical protein